MRPGDLVLVPDKGLSSLYRVTIRMVTRSRFAHTALVVDEYGTTVETSSDRGVHWGTIEPGDIILSAPLTDEQRDRVVPIVTPFIGLPYGMGDVVALGLARARINLPRVRREVANPSRMFCSQMVDHVWRLAGYRAFNDGRQPHNVSPRDLADLAAGWKLVSPTYCNEPLQVID